MPLCYHEEYFALGFLNALFIFAVVTLFEEPIKDIIKKLTKRSLKKRILEKI